MQEKRPYKRLLLKLSGELLLDNQPFGISEKGCQHLASIIKTIQTSGYELAIVIGGGNFLRGIQAEKSGMERTVADQMGMLATLINGLGLQQALEKNGCQTKVLSALECPKVVENYNWRNALSYLEAQKVVIFVGGTGNPYFSTDTAAALRASEIKADILLKATKVNGVYDKDPKKNSDAKRYGELSHSQYLAEKLQVMDPTSIALCRSNHLPVLVFNMQELGKRSMTDLIADREAATLIIE